MRHTRLRFLPALLPFLLATGSLGTAAPARAQMRADAVPDSVLRPYSIRPAGPAINAPLPVARTPIQSSSGPRLRDYSWLGGALQIEAPRETYDGRYTRPKVLVGVPSETMKDWLNAAGFSAEQCLLPMVRARARMTPDGEANGTLWLYARCSFQ
jgi:hypothetical protein